MSEGESSPGLSFWLLWPTYKFTSVSIIVIVIVVIVSSIILTITIIVVIMLSLRCRDDLLRIVPSSWTLFRLQSRRTMERRR